MALCALACCGDNYNESYFRLMHMPLSDMILHLERWQKLQELRNPRTTPQSISKDLKDSRAVNLSSRDTPAHRQAAAQLEAQGLFNPNNYEWKSLAN